MYNFHILACFLVVYRTFFVRTPADLGAGVLCASIGCFGVYLFPLGSCKNYAPEGCLLSGKQQHLPFYSYLRRGITLKKSVVADKSEKILRRIFTC